MVLQNRALQTQHTLPEQWLTTSIQESQNTSCNSTLSLPKNSIGQLYTIDSLHKDQQFILCQILQKLHEWLHCDNLKNFKPLRCTIMGQGGSGKSVLLNTITSVVRNLFQRNDVIKIACPTRTAAFNA